MVKSKINQKDLALLRADYLEKRESVLKGKVSTLQLKLFDKIFESYLITLEQNNGKLVNNEMNINLVKGLDSIYNLFNQQDNIPLVKKLTTELQAIVPLNERYFKNIAQKNITATTENATKIINKKLGLEANGSPVKNGFTEKFITDKSTLKKIKKQTLQAVTKGLGFQDFKNQLKETIVGNVKNGGLLQQYYRNYAYDTFQQTDRLASNVFAKELSLRYFIWRGGLIKTSRPICEKCNSGIIDSLKFRDLKFSDLKEKYQNGMDESWNPMLDLGGFGCRHSIDWIVDTVAQRYPDRLININSLLK